MSDYTPSLGTLLSAYRKRKPGTSYVMWASQDHVTTTPDAEFDRAIAKVRTEAKKEALREATEYFDHRATKLIEGHPVKHEDRRGAYTAEAQHAAHVLARMADNLDAG